MTLEKFLDEFGAAFPMKASEGFFFQNVAVLYKETRCGSVAEIYLNENDLDRASQQATNSRTSIKIFAISRENLKGATNIPLPLLALAPAPAHT